MKKRIALVLAASLSIMALAGCGGQAAETEAATTQATEAAAETEAEAEAEETEAAEEAAELTGEPILIGAIEDLSGSGSVLGNATLHGHELAIEDINAAGGIDGRPLELITYDCKSDPQEGISTFQRLAEVDNVSIVLGPSLSNVGLAVAPYSTQLELPFLGQFGDPRVMLGENLDSLNPYMFLMQPSAAQSAIISGAYMVDELGFTKVAMLIAQDHSYCVTQANAFMEWAEENGVEIVTVQYNNQDDIDMRTQLTNIMNSGAEFLFNANPTQPAVIITNQMAQLGMDMPMTGSLDFAPPFSTLCSDPANVNNIYYANNCDYDEEDISELAAKCLEKYGEELTPKTAMGYDQVLIAVEAIKAAGSTDPNAIRDALENLSNVYTTITDTWTMDPETHMPKDLGMVIYKIEGGEYVKQGWFTPES